MCLNIGLLVENGFYMKFQDSIFFTEHKTVNESVDNVEFTSVQEGFYLLHPWLKSISQETVSKSFDISTFFKK